MIEKDLERKEYVQPVAEVVHLDEDAAMLAGSNDKDLDLDEGIDVELD